MIECLDGCSTTDPVACDKNGIVPCGCPCHQEAGWLGRSFLYAKGVIEMGFVDDVEDTLAGERAYNQGVASGKAEERERCAKICDEVAAAWDTVEGKQAIDAVRALIK